MGNASVKKRTRDGLWTLREAADYLRFAPEVVRRKCRLGLMPHVRVFGRIRFRRHEIDAWLKRGQEKHVEE